MKQSIHYTQEQKEQARETNLAAMLRGMGEPVSRCGSEYQWKDGGQRVTLRNNLWYHQYEQVGGDAISFVERFFHRTYPEAVEFLLDASRAIPPDWAGEPVAVHRDFLLPPQNENMNRASAYLRKERGIDREVVQTFAFQKMIYESLPHHNVVFVGFNPEGIPCHATKRGIGKRRVFKGNQPGGDNAYSFHWCGTSERLYLFEAPIDLMSYISLHREGWKQHSYAACCGVSDAVAMQMLRDHPNIQKVILCLDNDSAGWDAADRIADRLEWLGYQTERQVPRLKDWNEDLTMMRKEEK